MHADRTCRHRRVLAFALGLAAALGMLVPLAGMTAPAHASSAAPAGTSGSSGSSSSSGSASSDDSAGSTDGATPDEPPPPAGIQAGAWLVADADSGAILAAHNPHQPDLPASTMKILTALTVLPGLPPDQEVLVGDDAARVDGTRVGLVPGIRYTVRDLATAMIIASGNDATVALVGAAGGTEKVLARMNAKAAALGATSTVAGDPSGLDAPGQVTTVHDLAVLGRAALNDPTVRSYLTIPRATLHGREGERFEIANHNALIDSYEGAIGVKNGYTTAAGATFVGAATRGDRTLIVALLRTVPAYAADARALLDWGFAYADLVRPIGRLAGPPDTAADDDTRVAAGRAADGTGTGEKPLSAGAADERARTNTGSSAVAEDGAVGLVTWAALGITITASLFTLAARRRRIRQARAARRRGGAEVARVSRATSRQPAARSADDRRRRSHSHGARGHGARGQHARSYNARSYNARGYSSRGHGTRGHGTREQGLRGHASLGYEVPGYAAYGYDIMEYDVAGSSAAGSGAAGYDDHGAHGYDARDRRIGTRGRDAHDHASGLIDTGVRGPRDPVPPDMIPRRFGAPGPGPDGFVPQRLAPRRSGTARTRGAARPRRDRADGHPHLTVIPTPRPEAMPRSEGPGRSAETVRAGTAETAWEGGPADRARRRARLPLDAQRDDQPYETARSWER